MKTTKWFARTVKPTIAGMYETKLPGARKADGFQFWSGEAWSCWSPTIDAAEGRKHKRSIFQSIQWRGLASDPSKGA